MPAPARPAPGLIRRRAALGPCAYAALLALAAVCCGARAHAGCIESTDPQERRLQSLAEANAREAIRESGAAIAAQDKLTRPDARRLALLYGVQAYSYSMLELDAPARTAAARGLKWTAAPTDANALNLRMIVAENAYDLAGVEQGLADIEGLRKQVEPGSIADSCLLITLGRLQYREDRIDLSVRSLTRAYADSIAAGRRRQRVLAAAALASVMRTSGDYEQAQSLVQEQIDWDVEHGLTLDLSVARYQRGSTLQDMGKYQAAIAELEQARTLSLQVDDDQGVAFADLHICESEAELKAGPATRGHCERALRVFEAAKSTDMVKETRATLAQLAIGDGHPDEAVAILNEVLEKGGADVLPRRVARMYRLRAQAEAQLGQYRSAYNDYAEYVRRYQLANEIDRVRQVTALSTRFDADREVERNESLQRQLDLAQERAKRQRLQLRWTAALGVAGVLVIALLGYIAFMSLRHRRALERLASEDPLTGLPNRRHTTELAEQLLAGAVRRGEVFTLALIDLDHFKRINDRCGHAEGDRVLREFARIARQEVRAGDVLGRWGGEEFLLMMGDCTLDYGLATLERLRAAVARIALQPAAGEGHLTLSAGLTTNEDDGRSLEELVARADTALYEAKHGGRDRVRVAEEARRVASTGVHRMIAEA